MAKVALDISDKPMDQRVNEVIRKSGQLGKMKGNVIIKPNMCSLRKSESGATTDPRIVEALIRNLLSEGIDSSEIFVVESETAFRNLEKAFRVLGYSDIIEKYDVKFLNLSKLEEEVVKGRDFHGEIRIPRLLLQDKFYISVAKLKTHCQEWISCSLKNQLGCLPDRDKVKFHPHLPELIADVNHIIRPNMAIVDGLFGMEGYGPIMGKPVEMNLIMCSRDLVALDAIACQIIGVNPQRVGHLRLCKDLGNMDNVELLGVDIAQVQRKFKQDVLRHMAFVFLNRYLKISI